ncbi:UDP-N-acetylmuramoyl-tripeptide--D-alanyl-D-alanine ligase [Edaphobacter albus]|uniref:UDP-N-acetylmuramoyl-tripeptide--D-alanyl-D- alanine ligase n=1 Tax=Edaphobacter sp. 4G125 TaxID=2763071 RepID=UPI0016488C20|nr:UDP-N-acetylmuramoyl-tripeptide--D-alanyl-D-alanine ligase [Edaphobacter sp. 4G125]QNI37839.1 UDP-N-acetylmuramoyl-tripeptide--D-alanyl-D-alanine ligase [Edaphobacter sp. 4G125]
MKLTLGQIADWIHAEGDFDTSAEALGYAIDSRTIGAGELFFAVKGERFDGHDFVASALADGAVAAVVSNGWLVPAEVDETKLLRVAADCEDCVLNALQRLAHAVRKDWGGRVIGVTGSAGKTTTKEAVAQVLSARFHVLKSAGNLNNAFGVPLQLLRLEREHEVAVIEMGMNHAGEIAALAKIAEPNWAVVSNVAPVHIEFFPDGLAGIARAKYELVESLPPDGIAILNADDPNVKEFGRGMGNRAIFYGLSQTAQVRAEKIEVAGIEGVRFEAVVHGERAVVRLRLLGRHNVLNALAAIAAGVQSGIPLGECAAAIAELHPADKRGEILSWHGATLINDSYNSNPRALDAMVDALMAMPAERHIVIAGEMLELGSESESLHRACGTRMAERGVSKVLGIRGAAAALVGGTVEAGGDATFLATPEEAGTWMRSNLRAGDAVLLKASRGVRLEKALAELGD